jgi:hypothetical protein
MRLPKILLPSLLASVLLPVPGYSAAPVKPAPITSASKLTVTGAGPASGSYDLTRVNGDWFVTASDGHANLHYDSGMGPRRVILDLEWDGKALTQTFNAAGNGNHSDRNHPTLYLTLGGAGGAQQMGEPANGDSVVLTITHMDASSIEATLRGTVTVHSMLRDGNPQWQVSGAINVHRDAPAAAPLAAPEASSGTGNCDPQIHDKLTGAEWRSATECEIKFDTHVRQAFERAFAPVAEKFQAEGWIENKKPKMGPINSIARHSENSPYSISFNDAGNYGFTLNEGANSSDAKAKADQEKAIMDHMAELMKDMAKNSSQIQELSHQYAAISQTSSLGIRVTINENSTGSTNFQTVHTVTPLSGGGTVLFIPGAQPLTGGGADAAEPLTKVLLGAWGATTAKPLGKDGEAITTQGALSKTKSMLSVQNIDIRITGGKEAAQQAIQRIDWPALRALLAGN